VKKKRIPSLSNSKQISEGRCETAYEALRSAVMEGVEYHADKVHGLSILVTCGTSVWIQQGQNMKAQKKPSANTEPPQGQREAAERLAILFANLIETKPAAISAHTGN